MAPPSIPEPVVGFIRQHIHSVSQLEVLLLLRERGGEWTRESVATELRMTEPFAESTLEDLRLRELVGFGNAPESYRYEPRRPELDGLVDQLAACYAQARYTVINLIFSVPGDSARSLADAFRIRRKTED